MFFLSITIISFLVDNCHLSLRTTANDLVTTDIYAFVFKTTNMTFLFTCTYTLIEIYCKGFLYSFMILI